ncbi:MAG: radical SAM family heme chaperone HemW [Armatimonadota bacterium]
MATAWPLSVYVHLPFCARKCHYCDFNSRPAEAHERARYLDALHREIDRQAQTLAGACVHTIFFGGGTPTIYAADDLAALLDAIRRRAGKLAPPCGEGDPGAEIETSIEANPETVDEPKLRALRAAGFNRLSLGAQSFDDAELELLGRGHTSEHTECAVRAARAAGFANLSLDLIYGLPGQTVGGWRTTLQRALALEPEHLSAYGLELAEGTVLAARVQAGEIAPISEAAHLAMREITGELCAAAGLARYEISNYARPGFECQHNLTYWRNQPYLGLGAGAWSYLEGVRWSVCREPADYVAALSRGDEPSEYCERLEPDGALLEAVMMGLRLTEGLSIEALRAAYGAERVDALLARAQPLARMGLVALVEGRLRLTEAGEMLHSEIALRLA